MNSDRSEAPIPLIYNEEHRLNDFDIDKETIANIFKKYNERNPDNELNVIQRLGKEEGIAQKLNVDPRVGLRTDAKDKDKRVAAFDDNVEEVKPLPHFCVFVWDAFGDLMIRLLIMVAVIQIILGIPQISNGSAEWVDGISIFIAVIVVVIVGSATNYSKEQKFIQMSEENKATKEFYVFRDGKNTLISPDNVLVGDVVPIKPGDILQVDGMLISGSAIKADESPLTGESDLVNKEPYEGCMDFYRSLQERYPDRPVTGKYAIPSPLVFSGTEIKQGVGSYLVLAVGRNSVARQIQVAIKESREDSMTPLESKLDTIAGDIGKYGLGAALLTLVVLFIRFGVIYSQENTAYKQFKQDNPNIDASNMGPGITTPNTVLSIILLFFAIIVFAIPEGLPLTVALSLAFSIKKMKDQNLLVRSLHACETMGNANYICTDKAGTLTKNVMSVSKLFDCTDQDLDLNKITGKIQGDERKGSKVSKDPRDNFKSMEFYNNLKLALALNTEIEVDQNETITMPSKNDLAFVDFLHHFGEKIYAIREKYYSKDKKGIKIMAFSPSRKRMSTLIAHKEFKTGYRMFIKGASEYIIQSISHYLDAISGEEVRCDNSKYGLFEGKIHGYASQTLTTIGIAYKDLTKEEFDNFDDYEKDKDGISTLEISGFVLIAIAGIEDKLKDGVPEAVIKCSETGINVIMATGDNIETAIAIAKQANILPLQYVPPGRGEPTDNISMTGEEFVEATGGLVCTNCWERLKESNPAAAKQIKNGIDVTCDCPRNKVEANAKGKRETDIKKKQY
jgi:Ca2+ transporting ATPase